MASLRIGESQLRRQQTDALAKKVAQKAGGDLKAQSVGAVLRHDNSRTIDGGIIRQPDMHLARCITDDQFASMRIDALSQDLTEG